MARQNFRANPEEKLYESFTDFSGGLNSELSNEKLKENEFPVMENVDLSKRGSARTRYGRKKLLTSFPTGTGQGMFFYYRSGQNSPDKVFAIGGKLYLNPFTLWDITGETPSGATDGTNKVFTVANPFVKGSSETVYLNGAATTAYTINYKTGEITFDTAPASTDTVTVDYTYELKEISIDDGGTPMTFQNSLPVEAVQYKTDLFIATGTKLVEFTYDSGTTSYKAKVVTPYTPSVLEAIYIGTNGLAANPDAYVQDGTSTELEVVGIKPAKRTGAVNEPLSMTAYINKPDTITSVDYKWEYRKSDDTTWILGRDWTNGSSGKSWDFNVDKEGNYDIRVTARDANATTTTAEYPLTNFVVNQVESKSNNDLPVDRIQTCRKILLHYGRILLGKDDTNSYQMYISDLTNPRYFPVTNSISFDTGKQEALNSIIRYRNMLVIMTKTTVQTLVGKSPADYSRNVIHDGIGCIADRSAKVVGNNIIFLSHEGIHILKPNQFVLEVMNVKRIDFPVKSEISPDSNACAIAHDSQYWICFPDKQKIYRLYYENGMWVKDVSTKLNIAEFVDYGEDVFEITKDGNVYQHDRSIYKDDGTKYKMIVETKHLALSAAFNFKRIKRLYVLAGHFDDHNVDLSVTVWADSAKVLNPTSGEAVVNSDGSVTWTSTTEPNMKFYTGTSFGTWIIGESAFGDIEVSVNEARLRGKSRRVKVRYEYAGGDLCEIYGFALEFKLKNP